MDILRPAVANLLIHAPADKIEPGLC
jgi:hypothetical protein